MKKILINAVCILLLLTGNTLYALPIGLTLPDTSGYRGDAIDIPVYVDSSLSGYGITSYQLQINYNNNIIRIQLCFHKIVSDNIH